MLGTSTRIWPDNYGADMSRTASVWSRRYHCLY